MPKPAKIINFIQRGKTFINALLYMDGSDGYSMDDLSQKYNLGITDGERDNKIVVQDDGNITVFSRKDYDASQLLADLATFNGSQFSVHSAAIALSTKSGPFNIVLGQNDAMKIAIDGAGAVTFALTHNLTSGTVASTNATSFAIVAATSDQMLIAIDGGIAVAITLTAGTRTAAQICTDINTALGATIATVDGGGHVVLTSTTSGTSSIVNVESPASHSAYTVLGFTVASHAGSTAAARTEAQIVADINSGMSATVAFVGGADSTYYVKSTTTGASSEVNIETVAASAYSTIGLTVADHHGSDGTVIL